MIIVMMMRAMVMVIGDVTIVPLIVFYEGIMIMMTMGMIMMMI